MRVRQIPQGDDARANPLGRCLFLEGDRTAFQPGDIFLSPSNKLVVEVLRPTRCVALTKDEDGRYDLRHAFKITEQNYQLQLNSCLRYAQKSSMSTDLLPGPSDSLTVVQVGVHLGVLVHEPHINEVRGVGGEGLGAIDSP